MQWREVVVKLLLHSRASAKCVGVNFQVKEGARGREEEAKHGKQHTRSQ